MEEKRRMKDEAARIARQQEIDEEQRLEVIILCSILFRLLYLFAFYLQREREELKRKFEEERGNLFCKCNFCLDPPQLLSDARRLKMPQDQLLQAIKRGRWS
jgi:hypothetical protein